MKGLGARLVRTVGAPTLPEPASSSLRDQLKDLGDAARRRLLAGRAPVSLEEAVGGEATETPFGPIWVVHHELPLEHRHGSRRLGGFYERSMLDAQCLTGDVRLGKLLSEDACFLDIEATGLEHGAGTTAFLVGVAYREGDQLITRQYLLREPSEEQAMLHCLLQDLDAHPLLVSFNGKSYDLSVLEHRVVMCRFLDRQTCRLKLRPHLDLLHLSRNLHRGRWENTRLGTLEEELLGFHRVDDLPGSLVPSTWFHYLRTGDAEALGKAVTHNLHDIWSMIVLADHLLESASPRMADQRPPKVSVNLGHLLLRRGDLEGAAAALSPFLSEGHAPQAVRCRALDLLATAARRTHQTALELQALETLNHLRPSDPEVLVRLAIALERRAKDIPAALAAARAAADVLPEAGGSARVERLEKRLRRVQGLGG